jgi:hypothetical protein
MRREQPGASKERNYRRTDRWAGTEIGRSVETGAGMHFSSDSGPRAPTPGHDKGQRANASLSPHLSVVATGEPVSGFTT